MSVKYSASAWDQVLPLDEKLVLLAMAENVGDLGICWPDSQSGISRLTGLSDIEVQNIVGRLMARGLVKKSEGAYILKG